MVRASPEDQRDGSVAADHQTRLPSMANGSRSMVRAKVARGSSFRRGSLADSYHGRFLEVVLKGFVAEAASLACIRANSRRDSHRENLPLSLGDHNRAFRQNSSEIFSTVANFTGAIAPCRLVRQVKLLAG
jgi:hypothetical protein